ncbi:MAG: hypothetical protein JXO72_00780 [Vicinamibacteria bacterium]|nr:hypothetical protein [Vicinamibacteria bacterium]
MRLSQTPVSICLIACLTIVLLSFQPAVAGEEASVSGALKVNGKTVALPYVYVYALEKGFYDENDPTWKILFVGHAVEERNLDKPVWDSAYVELGLTRTAEFGEQPELQVYSQSIRFSADAGGNISGGSYPKVEIESAGPERFAGRIYLPEEQKLFDDAFQYDFTFSAPLSDPDAPLGDPLPADGGEPGKAYLAWVAALHAGDIGRLQKLVPAEMASRFEGAEGKQGLEMMQAMTPTEVKVLGGSSDGQTAILKVEGVMDGVKVGGEVTLERRGEHWLATKSAW